MTEDEEAEDKRLMHAEVFDALKARGITSVEVRFSGGNDSGGVDEIIVRPANTELPQSDPLYETLAAPVYGKYYTFAGEFYVDGTVTWDVEAETVRMTGQETVDSYLDINEDL